MSGQSLISDRFERVKNIGCGSTNLFCYVKTSLLLEQKTSLLLQQKTSLLLEQKTSLARNLGARNLVARNLVAHYTYFTHFTHLMNQLAATWAQGPWAWAHGPMGPGPGQMVEICPLAQAKNWRQCQDCG